MGLSLKKYKFNFSKITLNISETQNVRRSSEISLKSPTIKFLICSLVGNTLKELCIAEKIIEIGLTVPKIWTILSS